MTATVQWHAVSAEVPDTDTTVLCGFADGEVQLGWLDTEHGGVWRAANDAMRFRERVEVWAHLPAIPARFLKQEHP